MLERQATITRFKVRSILAINVPVASHLTLPADLDKLENDGIPVFEKLVKCVGDYIDWWNWIALRANAQKLSSEQLTFKYSKIRSERAIKKWGELKESFVQYTLEVGITFICLSFCVTHLMMGPISLDWECTGCSLRVVLEDHGRKNSYLRDRGSEARRPSTTSRTNQSGAE